MTEHVGLRRIAVGAAAGTAMFVGLGTVAALWDNPMFMRMSPAGGLKIALLALQSVLAGVYVGLPPSHCGARTAGVGAALGFFGIACPTCNKVLVALLGAGLLLEYFEPVRLYVAAAGAALLTAALYVKRPAASGAPAPATRSIT